MTGQPTAAEVLAAHPRLVHDSESGWYVCQGCKVEIETLRRFADDELRQHQADMLAAAGLLVTPEHDAQVAARALREAVTYLRGWFGRPEPASIPVLAAYADRVERGEAT